MPSNYEKYQEGFRNPDGYTSLEGMVGAQRRREFDNFLSRNPGSAAPQAQLKNDRPRRSASMATAKSAAKACALLCAIVFAAYGWSERGGTLVVALGYAMAGAPTRRVCRLRALLGVGRSQIRDEDRPVVYRRGAIAVGRLFTRACKLSRKKLCGHGAGAETAGAGGRAAGVRCTLPGWRVSLSGAIAAATQQDSELGELQSIAKLAGSHIKGRRRRRGNCVVNS